MNSNNSNNLVINQSAAARILSKRYGHRIDPWTISLEPWACGVRCRVPGHRPTIISRRAFTQDFADYRKEGALSCTVEPPLPGYPTQYRVKSRSRDGRYHSVWLTGSIQTCTCQDFQRQKAAWGRGTCSHLIAVTNYLGFGSFSEAIAVLQEGQKGWSKLTKTALAASGLPRCAARKHYPGLNPVSLSDWEEQDWKVRQASEETVTVPSASQELVRSDSGVSIPASEASGSVAQPSGEALYRRTSSDAYSNFVHEEVRQSYC